ncbi:MAG: VOC family protein [Dehalococcoidia bacterium]|nr:VOC family protein [Dehalococcoidia bacterium]
MSGFDIWHLGLPVKNLQESLRFYVDGLGFELLGYYCKNLAFVRPPGKAFTIELMELAKDAQDADRLPHHLAFECENLESFHSDLLAKDFIAEAPAIVPSNSGLRLFTLRDPDGVRVQFYQGRAGFDYSIAPTATQAVAA